jgi:hypothetical protein
MRILSWSYPSGDTKDFTDNDSWVGAMLEGRRFVNPRVTASLGFAWNEFYENTDRLVDLGNGAISGDQYRDINVFPMLIGAEYYMGESGRARPYIGLGAGAYYVDQLMDIGVFTYDSNDWHFGIAPRAGVLIPSANRDTNFVIDFKYHLPFEAGDYLGDESRSWQYWTLGVGLSWSTGRY